ncbi:uncharacterized protein LOC131953092 [Physella acuta]|uniref:uncharacterized protein LOC131953092 n=1 Tax=Physella acuta TaxID=109671 RepID=UPI0027DBAC1A|nr:uncharacterized protein LOC131953092 [Physella acuta]
MCQQNKLNVSWLQDASCTQACATKFGSNIFKSNIGGDHQNNSSKECDCSKDELTSYIGIPILTVIIIILIIGFIVYHCRIRGKRPKQRQANQHHTNATQNGTEPMLPNPAEDTTEV